MTGLAKDVIAQVDSAVPCVPHDIVIDNPTSLGFAIGHDARARIVV